MKHACRSIYRRALITMAGLTLSGLLAPGFASTTYPSRAITAVVGGSPGQSSDLLMRVVATGLSERLGATVITENRPGAGASLAPAHVAKSAPDGYTLLLATSGPLTIRPNIFGTEAYDPNRSFAPVAPLAYAPMVLAVAADSGIRSLSDLVERARKAPNTITYGSPGVGSINHLIVEMLGVSAKVKLQHIPYKGSPQVFTDVIGGRIHLVADPVPGIASQLSSGKLRALAVTDKVRSPLLPDVPTAAEAGFPSLDSLIWFGLLAPAGTPDAVLDKLETAVTELKASDGVARRIADMGLVPMKDARGAYGELIRTDTLKWKNLIAEIGGIAP